MVGLVRTQYGLHCGITHTYMYECMYIHTDTHTHTHMYVCTYIPRAVGLHCEIACLLNTAKQLPEAV
jgi:hypothetical protein